MAAPVIFQTCGRPGSSGGAADADGERFLPAGTLVGDAGRYEVRDVIAIGGMSALYRAFDRNIGSDCALKVQYAPGAPPDEAASFVHEARLLASLQFSGIVGVRDVFEAGDYNFVAMDYIDGENLYDRHRRTGRSGEDAQDVPISPAPEDQVVLYGIALARTLDYLHTRAPAVVYRDLKPHNVMRRSSDGALVLVDFGIARRLDMLDRSCVNDEIGTPGYAAPEQYTAGSTIDARTDIYGLGVLLIELATGYNPRAEGAERFVPAVSSLRRGLSPSLAAVLQKCVEADPADRHQSASELLSALESWRATPRGLRAGRGPEKIWTLATEGQAAGPMQSFEGRLYVVDAAGACYAIEASVGHIDHEIGPPAGLPQGARHRLLPPLPGARSAATIARLSAAPGFSRLLIASELLGPLQQFDSDSDRLMAAWCADGDLLLVSAGPPRIARLTLGADGQWYCMWRNKLISEPTAVCACGEDAIVVNAQGVVKRIDVMGERVWQSQLPLWESALPSVCCIRGDTLLLAPANPDSPVVGIDASSGELAWQTPSAGRWLGEPLSGAGGATAIAGTRDAGLIELHLSDGSEASSHHFDRPLVGISPLQPSPDIVVLAEFGAGGRVVVFDMARHCELWSAPLGERGAICGPLAVGDIVCAQEIDGCIHAWRWESSS